MSVAPACKAPAHAKRDYPYATWTLIVVSLGSFLTAIASSSITLALPTIGRDLGIGLGDTNWIVSAFILSISMLLLPIGRLSDIVGHRRIYLFGVGLFALTALACGLAQSTALLIAARVAQGIGGAMIMVAGPALLVSATAPKNRGRAVGLWSGAVYFGLTIGPSLGGLILATLDWPWLFYINLPLALLAIVLGWHHLPVAQSAERPPFDVKGALCLSLALPLLLSAVNRGAVWGASIALPLFALGVVFLSLFLFIERRTEAPLLDLAFFRNTTFSGATASAAINYVALFIPVIIVPYCLEEALGFSPSQTGLMLSIQPVAMALCAPLSGILADKRDGRPLAIAGMLILALGLFGLSRVEAQSQTLGIGLSMLLIGVGTGIFIAPNTSALLGSAPRQAQGVAGGIMALARTVGQLSGIAFGMALFHAFGGGDSHVWSDDTFSAFRYTLLVAAGFALLGAYTSYLRSPEAAKQS